VADTKPIYQIQQPNFTWQDVLKAEYQARHRRAGVKARIVYAHPASEPKALTDEWRDAARYRVIRLAAYNYGVKNPSPFALDAALDAALLADRGSEGGDVLQNAADLLSDLGYSKQADVVRNVIADRANAPSSEEQS
jgi:hypothetical protein